MKRFWLGLIFVIAVAAGTWWWLNRNNAPATAPTSEETTTHVEEEAPAGSEMIIYTDNGFDPATVTIKVGTTVAFHNDGSGQLWVASDPHPEHTDYPGFDAERGYGVGQNYTFTFTRAGTWRYHNHNNSGHGGIIIVVQ